MDQPLHLLFADLGKAYDSVPANMEWKTLEHYSINNIVINSIKRLYDDSYSKSDIKKQISPGFYTTKGL